MERRICGYFGTNHHVFDVLVRLHDLFNSSERELVILKVQLTMLNILELGLPKVAQQGQVLGRKRGRVHMVWLVLKQ